MAASLSLASSPTMMLSVDAKKTDSLNYSLYLRTYITRIYAQEGALPPPETYEEDLRKLEALRRGIWNLEPHPSSITNLLTYHVQLHNVALKFPLDEIAIKIPFSWYPSFGKDRRPLTSLHVNFEKSCILFNIGALYARLAVNESLGNAESIKKACNLFQQSAGVFATLKERLSADWKSLVGPDMSQQALLALKNIMLGQAQECFVLKAVTDGMKEGPLAKLASKTAEYFDTAFEALQSVEGFPLSQAMVLFAKRHYYLAFAQFRKSVEELAAAKYGEEVGRLKVAEDALNKVLGPDVQKHLFQGFLNEIKVRLFELLFISILNPLLIITNNNQTLQAVVLANLKRAEKDNDIIYLQAVPKPSALSPITKADMVKPTPLPDINSILPANELPLFSKLVPFAVHQAVSRYTAQRDQLVQQDITRLKESTQLLEATLASLNLPSSIVALEQPLGLPPAIVTKCAKVHSEGGAQSLRDMQSNITGLSHKVQSLLHDTTRSLDEEKKDDDDMRAQFRERWTRKSSTELQGSLRGVIKMYSEKLEQAKKSDVMIANKLVQNMPIIEALSATKEELEASIPSSTAKTTISHNDPLVKALKSLLEESNKLVAQRTKLIQEYQSQSAKDDVVPALLELLNASTAGSNGKPVSLDESAVKSLFERELKKYDMVKKTMEDSFAAQEHLITQIQSANSKFVAAKQMDSVLKQREQALQTLENGYKRYQELTVNLQEGMKFYTDMQGTVERFLQDVQDFCFARTAERKDYLASITSSLANLRLPNDGQSQQAQPQSYAANSMNNVTSNVPAGVWDPSSMPLVYNQGNQGAPPGSFDPRFSPSAPSASGSWGFTGSQPPVYQQTYQQNMQGQDRPNSPSRNRR